MLGYTHQHDFFLAENIGVVQEKFLNLLAGGGADDQIRELRMRMRTTNKVNKIY